VIEKPMVGKITNDIPTSYDYHRIVDYGRLMIAI